MLQLYLVQQSSKKKWEAEINPIRGNREQIAIELNRSLPELTLFKRKRTCLDERDLVQLLTLLCLYLAVPRLGGIGPHNQCLGEHLPSVLEVLLRQCGQPLRHQRLEISVVDTRGDCCQRRPRGRP